MAINPDLSGIEVSVCVGGQSLFEYATDNEPIPKQLSRWVKKKVLQHQHKVATTKYIEIVEGQNFIINVSAKAPYELDCPKLQFRVFVDNVWIREPIMSKDDYKNKAWSDVIKGPVGEVNSGHRPMTFSAVKTTSEKLTKDEVAEHKERMGGVGEIIVEVHRRTEGRLSKPARNEITRDFEVNYEREKVHEKATVLSATSHGTTYGTAVRGEDQYNLGVWETKSMDGDDYMRAMFIFKYRSREALKQLLVIPRSPSPEPEPNTLDLAIRQALRSENQDDPVQELGKEPALVQVNIDQENLTPKTAEEMEVVARVLGELRGGKGNLKREREDDGDANQKPKQEHRDESNIKSEHLGWVDLGRERQRKKPKKWTGKIIIDLTESDTEPDYIIVD